MAFHLESAAQLFERALAVEIGIFVRTEDPKGLRQDLYAHQKALSPRYDRLIFAIPAGNTEVWICKRGADAP